MRAAFLECGHVFTVSHQAERAPARHCRLVRQCLSLTGEPVTEFGKQSPVYLPHACRRLGTTLEERIEG